MKVKMKLLRTYKNGWLSIEINERGSWRFAFGFPESGLTYSEWQKPVMHDNDRAILVNKIIDHFESIYHPERDNR